MSATPQFFRNIKDAVLRLNNASGTTLQTFLAGSTDGLRIKSLIATNGDSTARVLQIVKTVSAVDYILGEVSVPAGAGTDGATPAVNLLNSTMMPGLQNDGIQRFLEVANGTTLKIKSKTAITAPNEVHVVGEYGEL